MLIKTLPVGQLETNCYIVTNENTRECVVIDPGDESNAILNYIEDNSLKCTAILITHGHPDHTMAAHAVADETGAPLYMNERDDPKNNPNAIFIPFDMRGVKNYDEGDVVETAGMKFEIFATPGHTPGGVTIRCEDALFVGDTLFKGSCGRTDFPGASMEDELRSLKKICSLPGDYEVYPGHMDATTLERERLFNYYCRMAMQEF